MVRPDGGHLKEERKAQTHRGPPEAQQLHLVSTVPTCTRKTVLDAWNGYHSLAFDESDKDDTTFITE